MLLRRVPWRGRRGSSFPMFKCFRFWRLRMGLTSELKKTQAAITKLEIDLKIDHTERVALEAKIDKLQAALDAANESFPSDPGPITGTFFQLENETMIWNGTLPTFDPDADDVTTREVVTLVNGAETNREKLDNNPANIAYSVAGLNQGDKLEVQLRNFDDGDPANPSANPSIYKATANVSGAADQVAPGDPGAITGTFSE